MLFYQIEEHFFVPNLLKQVDWLNNDIKIKKTMHTFLNQTLIHTIKNSNDFFLSYSPSQNGISLSILTVINEPF